MSVPSTPSVPPNRTGYIVTAIVFFVLGILAAVPVNNLLFARPSQGASGNSGASSDASNWRYEDGDLTAKGIAEFNQAYLETKRFVRESTLQSCVDSDDNLAEGDLPYRVSYVVPNYAANPAEGSMSLVIHCGYQVVESLINEALNVTPDPYRWQDSYGIPLDLPPLLSRDADFDFEACYQSDEIDIEAGAQCVISQVKEFEKVAPAVVAASNEQARTMWSNKWTHPPTSPEVIEATNLLLPILESQPGAAAQTRLDLEVCKTKGAWQDAALRIAVSRQIADFDQEPGIAANWIFESYFNRYGTCSTLD